MEVAVGSLISSLVSDYLPVASIGVKIAFGGLLSRVVEKLVAKNVNFEKISSLFGCNKKKYALVYVNDIFTARAIENYLDIHSKNRNVEFKWEYDHMTIHTDVEIEVVYENTKLKIVKLLKQNTNNINDPPVKKKESKSNGDHLFSITGKTDIVTIQNFLLNAQQLLPNCLLVHRSTIPVTLPSKKENKKSQNFEDTTDVDDSSFGSIFFTTLERYFLQRDPIRAAHLGYKGSEILLGATSNSFIRSFLVDEYLEQKIEVSFLFPSKSNDKNMEQTTSLQFESKTLSVNQLREYTQHIFTTMLRKESEIIVQKFIRIHEVELYGKKNASWRSIVAATSKTFHNTIVAGNVQRDFIDDLTKFLDSATYYAERGTCWKRGYVLIGKPGGGKTSIIKCAAREFGLELFTCNLQTISGVQFDQLMSEMNFRTMGGKKHILAFEDVDRSELFRQRSRFYRRANDSGDDDDDNNNESRTKPKDKPVSMGQFLNAIDGLHEQYGRVVIFTANDSKKFLHPTKKLAALLRPGRVDKIIEVGSCTSDQIKRMYSVFFPKEGCLEENKIRFFQDLAPCLLSETFMQYDATHCKKMMYGIEPFITDPVEDDKKNTLDDTISIKKQTAKIMKKPKIPKPLSLTQITKQKKSLEKKLKNLKNILSTGDEAAIQWHSNCKLWLERFQNQEKEYQQMIDNFTQKKRQDPVIDSVEL